MLRSRKLACLSLVLCFAGCGPFTRASDITLADPARAVSDARKLIVEAKVTERTLRLPKELPESLQLPGLRYALVHEDHVDLVIARNPDWNIGARIWSKDAKREHRDQPTKYSEVFFFSYNNDAEESPDNIP